MMMYCIEASLKVAVLMQKGVRYAKENNDKCYPRYGMLFISLHMHQREP